MKYTLAFEIHPTGPFGLPEGDSIVVPAGSGDIVTPTVHVGTMTRVGHGTLSRYRLETEAIKENFEFGEQVRGTLRDNFIFLVVEAPEPNEAYNIAIQVATRFIQHLSLGMRRFFSLKFLYMDDENRRVYRTLQKVEMGGMTAYSLDSLRAELTRTGRFTVLNNPILDKALQYYEHAIFLFERREEIADFPSTHYRFILSASFLNLWKALSTIIGDPLDADYQSRYGQLGFDRQFFDSEIETVRHLRDDYDVAHYHLDPGGLDEIERNFGRAKEITEKVLTSFRDHLADGKPFLVKAKTRFKVQRPLRKPLGNS